MGYLDALTSSYFKTAQDGRKLFFPWGVLGRGYAIASEQDYKRLQRQVKVYTVISLVLIIGAVVLGSQRFLWPLLIGVVLFYIVWTRYLLRGLQPSDERLSLQDRAAALSTVSLWLLEIGTLACVGFGIIILVVDPGNWLLALPLIAFFGLFAAFYMRLLFLRRRAATTRS